MIQIIVIKPQRTMQWFGGKKIHGRITLFDMLIFQLKQDHFMSTAINFGTFLVYSYGQKFIQVCYLELLSKVHYIILIYKGGNTRNVLSQYKIYTLFFTMTPGTTEHSFQPSASLWLIDVTLTPTSHLACRPYLRCFVDRFEFSLWFCHLE